VSVSRSLRRRRPRGERDRDRRDARCLPARRRPSGRSASLSDASSLPRSCSRCACRDEIVVQDALEQTLRARRRRRVPVAGHVDTLPVSPDAATGPRPAAAVDHVDFSPPAPSSNLRRPAPETLDDLRAEVDAALARLSASLCTASPRAPRHPKSAEEAAPPAAPVSVPLPSVPEDGFWRAEAERQRRRAAEAVERVGRWEASWHVGRAAPASSRVSELAAPDWRGWGAGEDSAAAAAAAALFGARPGAEYFPLSPPDRRSTRPPPLSPAVAALEADLAASLAHWEGKVRGRGR